MTTETPAAVGKPPKAATLLLAGTCVAYLLLTGLDAKSTAVLAGSLDFFGLKTVALDGLLALGFGYVALRLRRGGQGVHVVAFVLTGAALWRAIDVLLDAASASLGNDFQYWRIGQLATAALLVIAGVAAVVASALLARRR
ncbi:hypothetical protein [Stackebrandtia nassauensis]|uniref:Uncharacterized protein n=1 Tax=Stackebrandtia nassauensis (strain DSM 44728 / CIP 108903 / NRRL B-16338 / NBRC 102104 / LLR-40K-21) TaxID=446470 RepID=D3Q5D8_STANL|nr:hypothetical protein [Stackebrandtia nassauensis]ADD45998.1 hypothetical protein Snas_6382 [Stackebrandtia nassauensis DSM 44728]